MTKSDGFKAFLDGCSYEAGMPSDWKEGWDEANMLSDGDRSLFKDVMEYIKYKVVK